MSGMTLDECEDIFDRALSSASEAAFCYCVEPLFAEYEIISLELGRGSIFWRARIIGSEPFATLSELSYPPPEHAKTGRLNDCGLPCFYISACQETALAEVGAAYGQKVQLAGFRVLNECPVRLVVIGEYANVKKNGYMHFAGCDPDQTIARLMNEMPQEEALKRIYIDKFFAHVLSDPKAVQNGYRFSRALAEAVYARNPYDGIVFPSVKDRGGFNLGIKADASDRSFHNVCCLLVNVGKSRRFGVADFTIVKSAECLDAENKFIWRQSDLPGIVGIYGMNKEEFDAASQDQDDRNALLNMLRRGRR